MAEEGTSHSAPETGQFLGEQREHHDRAPRVPGWGWTRPINGTLDVASVGDPLAGATAGTARDPSWCSRSSLTITPPPAGWGQRERWTRQAGPGTRREEAEGPTDKKQKAGWRGPQGDHGQKQEVKRKQATNRLCPAPPAQVQGPLRSRPKTETSLPPKAPGGAHSSLLWGRVLAACYSSGSSVSSDRAVRSLPPGSAYSHPAATSAKTSTQNFGPASAEGG